VNKNKEISTVASYRNGRRAEKIATANGNALWKYDRESDGASCG